MIFPINAVCHHAICRSIPNFYPPPIALHPPPPHRTDAADRLTVQTFPRSVRNTPPAPVTCYSCFTQSSHSRRVLSSQCYVTVVQRVVNNNNNDNKTAIYKAHLPCDTHEASVLIVFDGELSCCQETVHVRFGTVFPSRQALEAVICTCS